MKVEFHPQAQKEWQKLNPVTRTRLAVKLDVYVADPDAFRN